MFEPDKSIIAMVHVHALPGTPRAARGFDAVTARGFDAVAAKAVEEAAALADAGADAIMIENMHDVPYLRGAVGPEIVASMTAIGAAIRQAVARPLGIQILAGANREALAAASACGAAFVRAENFVYAHVADEGLMPEAAAGPLLRYRRQVDAGGVRIFADIKKKHAAHAITADVDLPETARTAILCGADGVIVTGGATGRPAAVDDVAIVREAIDRPVLVGSGVTPDNLPALWPHASGFIVGSTFKRDGLWSNELDGDRIRRFMSVVAELRG